MGDKNPIRTLGDYSKSSHKGYRNTIELSVGNNVVPLRSDTIRLVQEGCSFHGLQTEGPNQHLNDFLKLADSLDLNDENRERTRTIDQSTGGKLHDLNAKESWALLEDLALYDNKSYNDPMDFAKPIKAIALPQDVPSTSDDHLIKLENQYYMKNPKQAFVEYASSRTDEARGKWYTFKPEQNNSGDTYNPSWRSDPNLRLSKFKADFKQQQSKMTNKIDTMLKAIIDRIAGALPIDTVSLLQTGMGIEPQQPKEPELTLEDEFQDLHLNLPILEVLTHVPLYNVILDKLGDSKPFDTLADLGPCVNIIPLYVFKKLNIGLLEETDHIFGLADGTKSYPIGIVKDIEVHIGKVKLLNDFYMIDMKKDTESSLLVGRGFLATANAVIDCRMAKIKVEEGIIRTMQPIPTTRKLFEMENPREIVDLDHLYDT
uniref:MAK10-like protein n=1 Tax=Tanacetum cinerariifolium TaxID=118510 RepID=A0A6L2JPZ0_TANCI|nr:MAK10-like protein [Tanacetum cinerariifolium]